MRIRLFLSFALIVFISIVSFSLLLRQGTTREVQSFLFGSNQTNADSLLVELSEYYQANSTWDGVSSIMPSGGQGRGRSGGTASGSELPPGQRFILADASGMIVFDTTGTTTDTAMAEDDRSVAFQIEVDDAVVGYLLPLGGAGFTQGESRYLLERLNQAAITAAIIGGGLALVLAILLAYRLIRPVRELTAAAGEMTRGDLSQRVFVKGNDEIAELGHTFNSMAASLQDAEEIRLALTADIAHELRTPLAIQKAHLEALEDGIYPLTTENLQPILDQTHLLNRLVEDLRTLALVDAGQLALEMTPTDLIKLASRVVERFRPQAEAKNIHLEILLTEKCPEILLDPGRIEQILGNLLSNALRHTPVGGKITVQILCHKSGVELSVCDSGSGIPPEAIKHVFDRFYRADKSRSRQEGGTGLGLAIAQKLAQAQGGVIRAENHPEGGAVFILAFPAK
jgi:signal transduction histidine kinase